MAAWSGTPVALPEGNTTALAPLAPAAHAGAPDTMVSTRPFAPAGSRVATPTRPPVIMSPVVVIGLANPVAAFAHAGTPPATVRTWPLAPAASRCAEPPMRPVMMSPAVVIGLANPVAAFAHPTAPPVTVST